MTKAEVRTTVNGRERDLRVDPWRTLLDVLREDLDLTGTKLGCEAGECGACTVLVDGRPVVSCMTLAADADGREIVTIEGISTPDRLHPLQQAFIAHSAFQCGYCAPGVIMICSGAVGSPRASYVAAIAACSSGSPAGKYPWPPR